MVRSTPHREGKIDGHSSFLICPLTATSAATLGYPTSSNNPASETEFLALLRL